jgi:pyruvate formate lyase activating enzyme
MVMSLQEQLDKRTRPGELFRKIEGKDDFLQCFACGHYCKIKEGHTGVCKIRKNVNGVLMVPWGYVGAWQCDPIEKKPFYNAFPRSLAMSFGMLGCDFHCSYCQNWLTSQALRDPNAGGTPRDVSPESFVKEALAYNARVVTSTYNEPLITSEWAVAIFKEARKHDLITSYVSNGNGTPEVIDYLSPYLDLYKIDLKTFNDKNYRKLGGTLEPILRTIKQVYEKGIWLEVLTLVIPTFNDSKEELTQIAEFIADISVDIPWHVTGFHKDYKMTDPDNTPAKLLIKAAKIGEKAGLNYVYAGNRPGRVEKYSNTRCPKCDTTLIKRHGFEVLDFKIKLLDEKFKGACPQCGEIIAGRWEEPPQRNQMFYFF